MKHPELPEYTVISHEGNAETRDIDSYASKDDLIWVLKIGGFRFYNIDAIFHKSTDVTQEFEEYLN